jgi:hypothetical protein
MAQVKSQLEIEGASSTVAPPMELNYALMRSTMVHWVQQLAGDSWTNYNESDPGITILEHLCFALTELGLRAERPIQDILASPQTQRLQLDKQGLYAAQDILPGPALTLQDQRRWLLDQVADAANVWLIPKVEKQDSRGLYRAIVLPRMPEVASCTCPGEEDDFREDLARQVRRCAVRLRNLGEDLAGVVVMKPQPLRLSGKLIVNNQRHPDEIQADIIFRIGLYLAPEPCRHSLQDRLLAGWTPAEIFLGPPMQRGFVDDGQLAATIAEPSCQDLKEIIASVPGVLEVEDFQILQQGEDRVPGSEELMLKKDHFFHLQLDLSALSMPLQPVRDGHFVPCNPARIQRLLKRLWQDHRQSFAIEQSYQVFYPIPVAADVEDGSYASIQTMFPSVYGLMSANDDSSLTPMRHGQIKQLKGYLMVFDLLMADFAARISFSRDLLSPKAGGDRSFDYDFVNDIAGCETELLCGNYIKKLAELNQRLDHKNQRQAKVLDFLLAIYGFNLLPQASNAGSASGADVDLQPLLQAKQELLQDVVLFSQRRGVGVDYLDLELLGSPTALERRCAMELRARRAGEGSTDVMLEPVAEKASFGRLLPPEDSRRVRDSFLILDGLMAPLIRGKEDDRTNPFAGKTVATLLWPALANARNYRIGGCDKGEHVDLVCFDGAGNGWWLGSFSHARLAHSFAQQLMRRAGSENDAICIVEWLLLRHAMRDPGGKSLEANLFNFRVSLVVMQAPSNPADEKVLASLLRPHLPAHLEMTIHILRPRRFAHFLALRDAWLRSLAGDDPVDQASTSRRLAAFLLHLPGTPATSTSAHPVGEAETTAEEGQPPRQTTPTPERDPDPAPVAVAEPETETGSLRATASGPSPPALANNAARPSLPPPSLLLAPAPAIDSLPPPLWLAVAASDGSEGARCDSPVDTDSLRLWQMAGLCFLMRSLPWHSRLGGALTGSEVSTVLREGLALMPFQDPSFDVEGPIEALGRRHGQAAVEAGQGLRLPDGLVIWLSNVPGVVARDPAVLRGYLNLWCQSVVEAGYSSGLFLTGASPLSGLQFDWFCRWDPAASDPMLGFGLTREPASARLELLAGQGEILRIQQDRRGLSPPWLTLDPRARPPLSP